MHGIRLKSQFAKFTVNVSGFLPIFSVSRKQHKPQWKPLYANAKEQRGWGVGGGITYLINFIDMDNFINKRLIYPWRLDVVKLVETHINDLNFKNKLWGV